MKALGLRGGVGNLIVRREVVGVDSKNIRLVNVILLGRVRRPSTGAGLKLHPDKNGILYLLDFLSLLRGGGIFSICYNSYMQQD